jgi:histidine kinase
MEQRLIMVKILLDFNQNKTQSEDDRLWLFKNILKSVQKLHQSNYSHQHLSPKTIGISESKVQLIHHYAPLLFEKTNEITNQIIPNAHMPDYLSPEQKALTQVAIDYRSDIFALGVLFYWILTDAPPLTFHDGTCLFNFPHNINKNIKTIIEKMTSKLPEDRYQSISGILNDLEKVQTLPLLYVGKNDHPEHLHFDHHLFGRSKETQDLLKN